MAGSWHHITNDDGTPYEGEYGMADLLENGGDVNEFAEEAYGMVWFLADWVSTLIEHTETADRASTLDIIATARGNYKDGVRLGRGNG
jgi:hypothetical protein